MLTDASNLAAGVDRTFIFIGIISLIFTAGITGLIIYSLIRFSRKRNKKPSRITGSTILEISWTFVALVLVIIMFVHGLVPYKRMREVPDDAMQITAIGRMWQWEFDYGNGMKSKELVIPVNKPVKINLRSEDVIHSLFIPAFRVKEDVVPGYDNFLWFIPTLTGVYEILCTEYCGLLHSSMLSKARVLEQEEYDRWYSEFKNIAVIPEPEGYLLLRSTGCLACHSLDGAKLVGPSFRGLFGAQRKVIARNEKKSINADEEYINRSIIDPDFEIVEGFNKGLMKSYSGTLKDTDIQIIITYLKTIGEEQNLKNP